MPVSRFNLAFPQLRDDSDKSQNRQIGQQQRREWRRSRNYIFKKCAGQAVKVRPGVQNKAIRADRHSAHLPVARTNAALGWSTSPRGARAE